jgi:hypothetical protein
MLKWALPIIITRLIFENSEETICIRDANRLKIQGEGPRGFSQVGRKAYLVDTFFGEDSSFWFNLSNGHSPQICMTRSLLVRMCRGESHFFQKWPLANVSKSGESAQTRLANVGKSGESAQHGLANVDESGES